MITLRGFLTREPSELDEQFASAVRPTAPAEPPRYPGGEIVLISPKTIQGALPGRWLRKSYENELARRAQERER